MDFDVDCDGLEPEGCMCPSCCLRRDRTIISKKVGKSTNLNQLRQVLNYLLDQTEPVTFTEIMEDVFSVFGGQKKSKTARINDILHFLIYFRLVDKIKLKTSEVKRYKINNNYRLTYSANQETRRKWQ